MTDTAKDKAKPTPDTEPVDDTTPDPSDKPPRKQPASHVAGLVDRR
jgi:hypothetical protein